ncbi:hypothetical protein FA95DRAFT_1535440 [Auriscalpium vulgare]|uniref:Uncharacterized protein n=1 Tax=Auriscalpium vulgare TaxID=40419 RepID=A0ACB8S4B8_9AGAM|nr:hypothetical protein FA95DRAFT_1535440 [Auriscalpium vulgare]
MASTVSLPTLSDVIASEPDPSSAAARALAILFESSPILYSDLLPAFITALRSHTQDGTSSRLTYNALIDIAVDVLLAWPPAHQALFVGGHPRIGEVGGLSALSAREQAARATPPKVLARLGVLNAAYEARYPGLRYITFVNGRSRTEIMVEMQEKLGVGDGDIDVVAVEPLSAEGTEWRAEALRAIADVGKIAKSRLGSLGVDGGALP